MEKFSLENHSCQEESDDPLARASLAAKQAMTLDELRRSLVVTLTLKHKLTVEEAAKAIGRSTSWAYAARKTYISGKEIANRNTHGGRRNQILSPEEEDAFMDEACREHLRMRRKLYTEPNVTEKDVKIHRVVRKALEDKAGRSIPNSTAFALMARIGRRKFSYYYPGCWVRYAFQNLQP